MSEQVAGSLDLYLKIGLAVSVQGKSEEEAAATVVSISPGELELELSTPPSQLTFQKGEKVGIKYWDTRAVLYYWDAEVVQISRSDHRNLTISISGDVVVQRRKSHRVQSAVPFSFTVIEAAEPQLIDQKVRDSTTHDISVGGLAFETPLPLQVEDRLEIHLHLSSSQRVNVVGWVVRSEPIQGEGKDLRSVALMFLQLRAQGQSQVLQFLADSVTGDRD
jgi:c-di-GMP-binding flagellar brake protein YcgR